MKKFITFTFLLYFSTDLLSISAYDNFASFERFKKEKFYYPILTLNTEVGERFAFNPFDDLMEDDYQTIDAYTFSKGYYQIIQQFTKTSKLKLNYSFNKKEYDSSKVLNNKSDTYSGSITYKLLPDLTANIGIKYKSKRYDFDNRKNNISLAPLIEFKFKPRKEILIGTKYVYINMQYNDETKNSTGNRILIYWQERFYNGKLRLRARYRGEKRIYDYPTNIRKNSAKHSFSVTAKIDFN